MREKMHYQRLPISCLKPTGWYKKQLQLQADGLAGNLDRIWPDIRESRWIGGDKEGWERVPYWLDGFIPLACLLDDEDRKKRAKRYIDAILDGQQEDGWICPCSRDERPRYDVWAHFLLCKVLVLYEECTGDNRIEEAVYRAMRCLKRHLEMNTLFGWGSLRWFECLIPLGWLCDRRPEPWMKELALLLHVQGVDYETLFKDWPYDIPQGRGFWNFQTHVVNLAMALKSEAILSAFLGRESDGFAGEMIDRLLKYHGMPIGHFSGDECLSGRDPRQGTELCGVVEAMYSYEWLLSLTGEDGWADRLERLAFNGLPATVSADMWTHQYDQLTNQVQCSYLKEEENTFNSNSGEAHLFGLEPNYGCCTANMGQGWPKLATAAILKNDNAIAIGAIVPVLAATEINAVPVRVEMETDYPFRDSYLVRVVTEAPVTFTLSLRLPAGCRNVSLNGAEVDERQNRIDITREFVGETEYTVEFSFDAVLEEQTEGLFYVRRGPLVFSVPISFREKMHEFTRDGVERKFPYCDYELFPASEWNYALTEGAAYVPEWREIGDVPFSREHFPLVLHTKLTPVNWRMKDGKAELKPEGKIPGACPQDKELVPYGCTSLRMTAMTVE